MVNYQNGRIYKIVNETNDIYIGSCCVELYKRYYYHKCKKSNKCSSKSMINIYSQIVLIENYECKNREQLLMREQYWIDYHKNNTDYNVVNRHKSYRSKEELKEYQKQYQKEHYDKEYNNKNQKNYYQRHKEKEKERQKQYQLKTNKCKLWRLKNKDKIKEYQKERTYFNGKKLTKRMSEFVEMINSY